MATPEEEAKAKMDAMAKELAEVKKQSGELAAARAALEKKVEAQERQLLSEDYMNFLEKGKRSEEPSVDGDEDFDSLTGSQLVKRLRSEHQEALKKITDAYDKKAEALEKQLQGIGAYIDLEITKVKKPRLEKLLEVDETKAKLKAIAKDNPTWNAKKIFEHFELEERMALQQEADQKKAEEKENLQKQLSAVGEKGGLPQPVAEGKRLTREEAAEKAFELVSSGAEEVAEPQL